MSLDLINESSYYRIDRAVRAIVDMMHTVIFAVALTSMRFKGVFMAVLLQASCTPAII